MSDTTTITSRLTAASDRRALLRLALQADAAITGANGLAYLAAAGPLADLLGLSAGLLRGVGAFLVVFALAVYAVSRSDTAVAPVRAVIGANTAWAIGSVVAAIADLGTPATAGAVWMVLQAVVVAAFAELQLAGLRRARR